MQKEYTQSCVNNPHFTCPIAYDPEEETACRESPCLVDFQDDFVGHRVLNLTIEEIFNKANENKFREIIVLADDEKFQQSQYVSYNSSGLEEMWAKLHFDTAELCNTIIQVFVEYMVSFNINQIKTIPRGNSMLDRIFSTIPGGTFYNLYRKCK